MIGLSPDQQGFIIKCTILCVGLAVALAIPWLLRRCRVHSHASEVTSMSTELSHDTG